MKLLLGIGLAALLWVAAFGVGRAIGNRLIHTRTRIIHIQRKKVPSLLASAKENEVLLRSFDTTSRSSYTTSTEFSSCQRVHARAFAYTRSVEGFCTG